MNQKPLPSNGRPVDARPLVFVVDDEPMLLELASLIVEPLGCRVRTFRDPATAVQEFSRANPLPALVITDFAMHQMNGLDLIRDCRRVNPQQRVLLVSGTVEAGIFRNSPYKPDAFLSKPYQASELADLVKALLGK